MNPKTQTNLKVLTECSIMIALSTVLSIVKLFEMPYGGSITLASMMPIAIISYRHGTKQGLLTALVTSVIQMLLGLKNFSYFTSWQSLVALGFFDYIAAFSVFGLCGIFRKTVKSQNTALVSGTALASVLRYVCHVISGATVWAGLSIPTEAALLYSFSYNATYMIPETIILVLCTAYAASALDFRTKLPIRIHAEKLDKKSSYCLIGAGAAALATLIADTILVFSKLQNSESGEFDITALQSVNWLAFGITSAVGILLAVILVICAKNIENKRTNYNL